MTNEIKSSLSFEKYLVNKVDFKMNDNYKISNKPISLDLDFDLNIEIDEDNSLAVIKLVCTIFKKSIENNFPFSLEIEILGFFSLHEIEKEKIYKMLELNGTAILFPYLRSYITTLTSNAGISPLIIPTLNISKLIKNKKNIEQS